jgi:hypothetical protein
MAKKASSAEQIAALQEQVAALAGLVGTLVNKIGTPSDKPIEDAVIVPKKRGRPKKVVQPEPVVEVEEDLEESEEELTNPDFRVKRAPQKIKPLNSKERQGKTNCRTEPLGKFRNNFDKLPASKQFKNESAIDKKLWGENERVERSRASKCLIDCKRCNKEFEVSMSLVHRNSDTGEYEYICDRCIGGK